MLLVRHAQSEWNAQFSNSRIDLGRADPDLTSEGIEQAKGAVAHLRHAGIKRLVTSPYRRAIRTAVILADGLGVGITVDPLVRERRAFSCDQGSQPEVLAREWPELDLAGLEPVWWGRLIESVAGIEARAARFMTAARLLPDADEVAVISHWGFIRCAAGAEVGNVGAVRLKLSAETSGQTRRE